MKIQTLPSSISSRLPRVSKINQRGAQLFRRAKSTKLGFWSSKPKVSFSSYAVEQEYLTPTYDEITVAAILDDFSWRAFSYEFNLLPLRPDSWRKTLEHSVDFVLIESAWAGNDGAWTQCLRGEIEKESQISRLCHEAKSRGIPVVVWNKEDPYHFSDFLSLAKLADIVLTTDEDLIGLYKANLPQDSKVYPFPFAASPAIHNPVRRKDLNNIRTNDPFLPKGDVAFAGTYFREKFPERREQTKILINGAMQASKDRQIFHSGLTIFSRNESIDRKYRFPKPFAKYVVGNLDYSTMLTAYRFFAVFLNVNSVTNSSSMCSRRVFELAACSRVVVELPNPAVDNFFDSSEIVTVTDVEDTVNTLRSLIRSPHWRDVIGHRAARKIWTSHTYTHRADTLLRFLNLKEKLESPHSPRHFARTLAETSTPKVTAIVVTKRPQFVKRCLMQLAKQKGVELEIILITHGFLCSEVGLSEFIGEMTQERAELNLKIVPTRSSLSLGACLNVGTKLASHEIIAKIDDDDTYEPHYLLDLSHALFFSRAAVVGKQCVFVFDHLQNLTLLRAPNREHCFVDQVLGATIMTWKSLAQHIPFPEIPSGEDTEWQKEIRSYGYRIYSADRFNFAVGRHLHTDHTWSISFNKMLRNSRVVSAGIDRAILIA